MFTYKSYVAYNRQRGCCASNGSFDDARILLPLERNLMFDDAVVVSRRRDEVAVEQGVEDHVRMGKTKDLQLSQFGPASSATNWLQFGSGSAARKPGQHRDRNDR
eukprot:GSA120T00025137001.1